MKKTSLINYMVWHKENDTIKLDTLTTDKTHAENIHNEMTNKGYESHLDQYKVGSGF